MPLNNQGDICGAKGMISSSIYMPLLVLRDITESRNLLFRSFVRGLLQPDHQPLLSHILAEVDQCPAQD